MFRLVQVGEHERGLWFRRGNFLDLIMPGSTWLLSWQDRVDIIDTRFSPRFDHPMLDLMLEKPQLRAQLEVIRLEPTERAVVWQDGKLLDVLEPGLHAYWKTPAKLKVETISIPREWVDAPRLHSNRMEALLNN